MNDKFNINETNLVKLEKEEKNINKFIKNDMSIAFDKRLTYCQKQQILNANFIRKTRIRLHFYK